MKTHATTTRKLLTDLSGDEAFSIFLGHYMQQIQEKATLFTDSECEHILSDLRRRPHDGRSIRRWWDGFDVVHHLSKDAKCLALDTTWRITVLYHVMLSTVRHSTLTPSEKREKILTFLPCIRTIQYHLDLYERLRQFPIVFGELHQQDLTPLIGEVAERLEQHIAMLNDANDYLSDEITFELALAAGKENLEDTDFQSLLPHLSTDTLPPDFSERILAAIHTSFK